MSKTLDWIFATQFCTVVAFGLIFVAYMIGSGQWLNANWERVNLVLVPAACCFFMLPYMLVRGDA